MSPSEMLLSATTPNLIFIVVQREEEVQHMVQTRDKLHKAVERYKTEYNNLVARDVEEQVTHFKIWYRKSPESVHQTNFDHWRIFFFF
jgi:hypothetical protein